MICSIQVLHQLQEVEGNIKNFVDKHLSKYTIIYTFIHPSIYNNLHLFIHPSTYLYMHLSIICKYQQLTKVSLSHHNQLPRKL